MKSRDLRIAVVSCVLLSSLTVLVPVVSADFVAYPTTMSAPYITAPSTNAKYGKSTMVSCTAFAASDTDYSLESCAQYPDSCIYYSWSDGGAGGSFSGTWNALSVTYTTPSSITKDPGQDYETITLTVTADNSSTELAPDPTTYGTVTIRVYDIGLTITSVSCPNGPTHASFLGSVTGDDVGTEDEIACVADIKPDAYDDHNADIQWEIEDDPGQTGDSGNPADPETGNSVSLVAKAADATGGRTFKLNFRIQASVVIDGITINSAWHSIIQDDPDQLRQQYVDVTGYSPTPARDALDNSASYDDPGNLTFSQCQCHGTTCGNHSYLWDSTVSSVYQSVRNQHGSEISTTCCYRCPRHNNSPSVGSDYTSKHPYGNAFDFDNGDAVPNWAVAQSAKSAGVSTTKVLLYKELGVYYSLSWLEANGYNATNLPSGWTNYIFGHVTTN